MSTSNVRHKDHVSVNIDEELSLPNEEGRDIYVVKKSRDGQEFHVVVHKKTMLGRRNLSVNVGFKKSTLDDWRHLELKSHEFFTRGDELHHMSFEFLKDVVGTSSLQHVFIKDSSRCISYDPSQKTSSGRTRRATCSTSSMPDSRHPRRRATTWSCHRRTVEHSSP